MPKARKTTSGLEMYYEVSGVGSPVVVIPGGLMTIEQMGGLPSALAKTRQVVAVEPQAHGHTADINRPLSCEHMADDVAALIAELGLERVDVCGFSLGAGTALQMAIRHPTSVRKLVFLSGVFKSEGEYQEIRAFTSEFAPDMPMLGMNLQAYVQAAGSPEGWPALVEKTRLLLCESYDWSTQVAALSVPVLIVAGDSDTFPVAHALEMFRLLGGDTSATAMGGIGRARLAVLPGTNHFGFMQRLDLLVPILSTFLE